MKPFLAALLAAGALTAGATPVLAQPGFAPGAVLPGHDFHQQLEDLQRRINDGVREGQLDRGEFDRAQGALNSIRAEEGRMRMNHGGELTDMDRGVLQQRIDELSRSIHWMRDHGPLPPPPVPVPAPGVWSLDQREAWLQERIDRGRANGSLDRREVFRAERGLQDIRRMQADLTARDGGMLNPPDRHYLEERIDQLRSTLNWMQDLPPWARP
jgi:hypothetical protein